MKRIIIFDIGAVLIELDFQAMYEALAWLTPENNPAQIKHRFIDSGLEKPYNLGQLTAAQYHEGVRRKVLGLKYTGLGDSLIPYQNGKRVSRKRLEDQLSDENLDRIRSLAIGEPIYKMVELKRKLIN